MKTMTNKVSQLMSSNSNLQMELSKVKQENEVLRAMLATQQQQHQQLPMTTPLTKQYHPSISY